jgi:hypothetical protein
LFRLFWLSLGEVSRPDLISRNQSQFLFPKSADSCCPSPFFSFGFPVPLLGGLPCSVRQASLACVVFRVRSLCRTVPLSRSLQSVKLPVRLSQVLAALSLVIFLTLTCTAPAKPISCSKWSLLLVSLSTLVSRWCCLVLIAMQPLAPICFSRLCWVAPWLIAPISVFLRLPLICVRPVSAVVIQVPQFHSCCD